MYDDNVWFFLRAGIMAGEALTPTTRQGPTMASLLSPHSATELPNLGLLSIDHVGIAVSDTAVALRLYRDLLGLQVESSQVVARDNVRITFLAGANTRLELVEPLPGDSPVARFLEKRGEGLHHVCFVVPDLAATLRELAGAGYQLVDERPRRGHAGELVAFVHPKSTHGVLIEFYQRDGGHARRSATGGSIDGGTDTPDPARTGEPRDDATG
jgi:methylmalonyl-CoA/ethylmalonyl-CoA epimerase